MADNDDRVRALEERVRKLEASIAILQSSDKVIVQAMTKASESIGPIVTTACMAENRMAVELALTVATAFRDTADQTALDLNALIIILERHLELRERHEDAKDRLLIAETFVAALRAEPGQRPAKPPPPASNSDE